MILEELATQALKGDHRALEGLMDAIRDRIYNLSLRMLWHPADAEDATQEILIRIFTHLGTFRGDSSFVTWAYRIATNYLLTTRKRRMELMELSFEAFAEDLDRGLAGASLAMAPQAEDNLLAEEVKIGCTHAMLLCLDRNHRMAYILGEILELTGEEAAFVLEISPEAFRKRISRARKAIADFMNRKCGIVNPTNPCRCARRIRYAKETGRLDEHQLLFAGRSSSPQRSVVRNEVRLLNDLQDAATVLRSHPQYAAPDRLREGLRKLWRKFTEQQMKE